MNLSLDWKLKKDGKKNLCLPFAGYSHFHFGFTVHLRLVKDVFGAREINIVTESPTNGIKLLILLRDMVACCEVLSSPSGHRADDIVHKITEVFNQVGSRYPHSSTPLWKWRIFFSQSYVSLYVSPNFNGGFSFYFSVCMWRSECTCLC